MVKTAMDFIAEESILAASAICLVSVPRVRLISLLLSARKLYTCGWLALRRSQEAQNSTHRSHLRSSALLNRVKQR